MSAANSLKHLLPSPLKAGVRSAVRQMGYHIERISEVGPPAADPIFQIPEVELGELLGDAKAHIQLTVQKYEDGMLPSNHALAVLSLVVAARPKAVLEIGTFMGHTTKFLAMNLPEAIIHTMDLPVDFNPAEDSEREKKKDDFHLIAKRQVGREYRGTPYETQVRQHFGDTATWNFKEAAGATFFFIDGSHTYDYCKSDSDRCYELCRGRGVFVWHDCDETHPGVVQALLEWRAKGREVVRIQGLPIAYWNSTGKTIRA